MIKDISLLAWRVGLVLIILMPLLYFVSATVLFMPDQGGTAGQILMLAQGTVPAIFMSMAIGLALCLLVRIERRLRPGEEGTD